MESRHVGEEGGTHYTCYKVMNMRHASVHYTTITSSTHTHTHIQGWSFDGHVNPQVCR